MAHNIIAVIADCDDTLAPDTTAQILGRFRVDADRFYDNDVEKLVHAGWDPALAYMHEMILLTKQEGPLRNLTRQRLTEIGAELTFYPGIPEAFPELKERIEEDPRYKPYDIRVEFYVITGGIEEMLSASRLRKELRMIWGCNFAYDSDGRISVPRNVVSFTDKTRFIFAIQKGQVFDEDRNKPYKVNEPMEDEERRIPFRNMVYLGDGPSDIPCMSLLKNEAFIIGILNKEKPRRSWALGYGRRANITVPPDFRSGEHGYIQLHEALKHIADNMRSAFEYQRSRREAPKF